MRRLILSFMSAIFGVMLAATAVFADSPSFHSANASVNSSTGALSVSFKETGLGNVTSEQITLSVANASATFQCFNNGNNHPEAANKSGPGTLSSTGSFPVRNGQTTGVITVGPPTSSLSCPKGQTRFLVQVTYDGITITGAAGTIPTSPSSISLSSIMIKA